MPYAVGKAKKVIKIGILALQGAFREHVKALERLGVQTEEVRGPEELDECHGLVLPGGETTTQRKLAKNYGLWEPLRDKGLNGLPLLATCAGLILLAKRVDGRQGISRDSCPADGLSGRKGAGPGNCPEELSLELLDIDVVRNAYGRQVHSFEAPLEIPNLGTLPRSDGPFPAVFIRAPRITRVGQTVSILGTWKGEAVAVEQGNILGLAFHPELTPDDRFHRYFLDRVKKYREHCQNGTADSQVSRTASNVSFKSLNL